jgi:DUF4097 and DUF4098 domain-containing protein YvlB
MKIVIRALGLAALLLASNWTAAGSTAEGRFDRTLNVTGEVDLNIQTGSGEITVRKGAAGTVKIHGMIRASNGWHLSDSELESRVRSIEQNPPITQEGNVIRIGHTYDNELMRNISISYEITAPAESRLHSETGSGGTRIEGLRGPIDAATGSGNMSIEDAGAEVNASTGSGGVDLHNIRANVRVTTGSGHIAGIGLTGAVSAGTGSGSIRIEGTGAGDFDVHTGSGSIELTGVKGSIRARAGSGSISARGEQSGEWRLHTGSGDVSVRLPQNAAFELEARTSSGDIHTERPITVQGTIGKHELRGKVGSGGPLLELSTSSGTISIE